MSMLEVLFGQRAGRTNGPTDLGAVAPVPQDEGTELVASQINEFLEKPLRERSDADSHYLCSSLRKYMRHYAELRASCDGAAGRERELQFELSRLRHELEELTSDLAEQRAGTSRAQYLARHDSLTGLPNRAYLLEWLEATLSSAPVRRQTIAMLYLDVDDFKYINDTFGHCVGDAVLRIVSARLRRTLRSEDMVGRVGGDEFVCLLTGFQSRGQVRQTARKILDAMAAPERVNAMDLNVTISIGIALYPQNGSSAECLLRQADTAMYHSKKQRLGYAFCDEIWR